MIFRRSLPADVLRRLQLVDRWYGITAGLVIVTGVSLLLFASPGASFFTHNPVFWLKMALFVTVALISIAPTRAYLRWSSRTLPDGSVALDEAEYAGVRRLLFVQVAIFLFIPLCATLMANGI